MRLRRLIAATCGGALVGGAAGLFLGTRVLAENPGIHALRDRLVVLFFFPALYLAIAGLLGLAGLPIAPFHIHLLPVSQAAKTADAVGRLYTDLLAEGFEVLWDDRDDRAGVKFNDADLIGAPFQIVIGDKGLADGVVELKVRRGVKSRIAPSDVVAHLLRLFADTGLTPPPRSTSRI